MHALIIISTDVAVIQAVCVLVWVVCERMEGRPPPPRIGSFILGCVPCRPVLPQLLLLL